MPKSISLLNLERMLNDSGKDASPEVSFLKDLDYTIRKMNSYESHYYFKEIKKENNPEYFEKMNVICLTKLPEIATKEYLYEDKHMLIHTNDQKYYVCLYSDAKPSKKYKPSSLHCIRCMYYQMVGQDLDKQSDKSGDFYGICESGEDRHIRIQRAISNMSKCNVDCEFIDVESYVMEHNLPLEIVSKKEFETKLYDRNRNLIFLCDGIIKYKNKYYILEVKTETSYKWMSRECVDNSHKFQSYAYSLELGIEDIMFLYENRDICTKKSFCVHVTDDQRNLIAERLSICDDYVKRKSVPPIEKDITNKICQYCDYKTSCKLDGR